jgi:hypothetical protein
MIRRRAFIVWVLLAPGSLAQAAEDSARRQSARKLIDAVGIREQLSQAMPSVVEAATKQAAASQSSPYNCKDEFWAEWKKRFTDRMSVDRVIEVIVPIYEKHFSSEELNQLTAMRIAARQGKPQQPSKELLEKLQEEAIDIQSETTGATTQLGAKTGAEVGQQIGKEHPDWCTRRQ